MKTISKHLDNHKDSLYRSSDEIYNDCVKTKVDAKQLSKVAPQRIQIADAGNIYEEVREKCYPHFVALYSGSADFAYYEPAYRFGAELAVSARYGDQLWQAIEDKVCAIWEEVNPNTWDIHHGQVTHGWNVVQHQKMQKKQQLVR